MKKLIIFGNSGSGKSTLAKQYADRFSLAHLDLDSMAWLNTEPPQRKTIGDSAKEINAFIKQNENWIIEGCYADLLLLVTKNANEMIFINSSVDICIKNSKARPWEPHKYSSKQAQDNNLKMLIEWIKQYPERTDEFSLKAHRELFDSFEGNKIEYNSNERNHEE